METLPDEILKEDVYDETGHVDTEFLTAILKYIADRETLLLRMAQALSHLLGCDRFDDKKENTNNEEGTKWTPEEILKNCTMKDNVLYLPKVQFNKKSYNDAKKWIEEAGGKWNTSLQGFTFEFDATRVFSILNQGKRCNLKKDFQFFATPDHIADAAVSQFTTLTERMKILEPSAGRGSLVKAVRRRCPCAEVDCYELMPENVPFLEKVDGAKIVGTDFMTENVGKYDRIIANPPFTGNQDIDHVMRMYDHLNKGGEISVIVSQHWKFAEDSKSSRFRDWLKSIKANITDIDSGEFKESGTSTPTSLLWICKP